MPDASSSSTGAGTQSGRRNADYAVLDFERPIMELERKIRELKQIPDVNLNGELKPLERKRDRLLEDIFGRLSPWQIVSVARHPDRPQFMEYVEGMCDEYVELHGDRLFGDDHAISTGFARIGDRRFLLVGQRKGRDVKEKLRCNFGCAHPEGYRKALAKMKLAARFGLPIVTMINTPGAYPGVGAEERGQAWAIAENIMEMSRLDVPVICIVIGEGGSGGALGIGVGDRVLMLEYAYYSVISPEGCAGILWHDGSRAKDAAEALRLTSRDLERLKVIDEVIKEPLGAAHRDPSAMIERLKETLVKNLDELSAMDPAERMAKRYERLRGLGNDVDALDPQPELPAGKAPAKAKSKKKK
ncbi:MAG: acetyl-CoA carboxylase carboxyltransferase subunit alpha [Planctomycetota bacterium]|nr:acetyl-CoA carboxylase carboxyltransferase subunit alpha [Planctomycetota bacterium]